MTVKNRTLKMIIKARGLTQERLADDIGMEYKTLNKKINERRSCFDVKELRELSRALELTDEQLLDIVKGEKKG